MSKTYVKLPYETLVSLIASDIRLDALDLAHVEQWDMYGCNFDDTVQEYINKCREIFKDLERKYYTFEEAADIFIRACAKEGKLFEIIEEE